MEWTKSTVEVLKTTEVGQLRANAEARGKTELVALCDEVLAGRPKTGVRSKAKRQHELDGRPLVSRGKAFDMRGVKLRNPRWSWGGMRATDGIIVLTIWAKDIETAGDKRSYMLYGPARGGDRLWSDTPGGKERLEHCRAALSGGEAEGILIYGERRGQDLPLEEASRVTGADPHTTLRFRVGKRGDEYWAVWGGKLAGCRCCEIGTPTAGPRVCPECTHVFQGNGWDGIDAHWRAGHEVIMPYKDFWHSLCEKHRGGI